MKLKLDPWQKEFLETEGDKILCCGRQVGKSVICGMDGGEYAANHPKQTILMIAPTERQAYALFEKTLLYLQQNYPKMIKKGKHRPTRTKINLTNGAIVWCLPTGLAGTGIRFLTVNRVYVDECSRVPEEVFPAVSPMLMTTAGQRIYLSTPYCAEGEFYNCWVNRDDAYNSFTRFSIESETCIRKREICDTWTEHQREKALEYIERQKKQLTAHKFAEEYLGQFVESLQKMFPHELVMKCMTIDPKNNVYGKNGNNYLGVDIARMGSDETVLFSIKRTHKEKLRQIDMKITKKTLLTDTVRAIKNADLQHNYKRIYIDDGGIGAGVLDPLLEDPQTRRKVVGINNASRSINRDKTRSKKLMKEDLYANLRRLMEQSKIELFKDEDIMSSLESVQYEYSDAGRLKIYGHYTHITEALIRAAWCTTEKGLNIWIDSF